MAGGGKFEDANAGNVRVGRDFGEGGGRGKGVEIEDTDGTAAGSGAADGHLGDVDFVIAKDRADGTDDAGAVVVGENEQIAIEIGFESEFAESNEARHVGAEERAAGIHLFA